MLGLSKERRVSGLSRPTVRNKETGITHPAFRTVRDNTVVPSFRPWVLCYYEIMNKIPAPLSALGHLVWTRSPSEERLLRCCSDLYARNPLAKTRKCLAHKKWERLSNKICDKDESVLTNQNKK